MFLKRILSLSSRQILKRNDQEFKRFFHQSRYYLSVEAQAKSQDNPNVLSPNEPSAKINQIVDQIGNLTLLEVAELNQALKQKLNIPDAPVMSFAAGVASTAPAAPKAEDEEAIESAKTVQTVFTLKITKFDEGKKVALIKEVKNLVEGLNLVQAKKFVESLPQVVKNNLSKEEAENLKKTLENVGATCTID